MTKRRKTDSVIDKYNFLQALVISLHSCKRFDVDFYSFWDSKIGELWLIEYMGLTAFLESVFSVDAVYTTVGSREGRPGRG